VAILAADAVGYSRLMAADAIYGGGVNIAARLQAIAAPGAVVASESLRLAVRRALMPYEERAGAA